MSCCLTIVNFLANCLYLLIFLRLWFFFSNSPIFVLAWFVSHTGFMNLVVTIIIFGVAVKVYRNFGGGLAQHCKCQ